MLEGSLKAGSAVGVRGERVGRTEDVLEEDRKGPVEERGDGKGGEVSRTPSRGRARAQCDEQTANLS